MSYRNIPRPRRYRDSNGDLWIEGNFYMGRVRVPTMPPRLALTDRETGNLKVLGSLNGVIDLVDINPAWTDVLRFGASEGPIWEGYRLLLEDGELYFELADTTAVQYSGAMILTREAFKRDVLMLSVDADGETVVYTPYTL